jgi:regulator of replication initiation timing
LARESQAREIKELMAEVERLRVENNRLRMELWRLKRWPNDGETSVCLD